LEVRYQIHKYLILLLFAYAISVYSVVVFIPAAKTAASTGYSQDTLSSASLTRNFTIESLFIALASDGDAIIEYDVRLPKTILQRTNIELIGDTIEDLAISDYLDNPLSYRPNEKTKEVSINSSLITNLLISYSTPDLVDKQDRVWTFSIDSPVAFSLKLPPESQIIKLGGNNSTSLVRRILQEDLLTFSPGNSQISYIIGPQGTNAEANTVIKSAELSIKDAMNNFPGINLTEPQDMLQHATVSKLNGQNLDAAKYAIESNNIVQSIVQDYKSSQDAINEAEKELDKLIKIGADNKYSLEFMINEANTQFRNGQYDLARLSAEDLIIQLTQNRETLLVNSTQSPIGQDNGKNYHWPIVIYVVFGSVTALTLGILFFRKTHYRIGLSSILSTLPLLGTNKSSIRHNKNLTDEALSSSPPISKTLIRPKYGSLPTSSETPENNSSQYVRLNESATPSSLPLPSFAPSSPFSHLSSSQDQSSVNQRIRQILSERPHLRDEDKQLIELLAEEQGAAFERDIRRKLLLPKTSVWRLVRRLEREELVEVIKVGSQNLIKLKCSIDNE
jgi:uncharacterized membrane protein